MHTELTRFSLKLVPNTEYRMHAQGALSREPNRENFIDDALRGFKTFFNDMKFAFLVREDELARADNDPQTAAVAGELDAMRLLHS